MLDEVVKQERSPLRQSAHHFKRGLILDAAAAVFAERGYLGASTTRIADRLGMTQSNLYNYFSSKDEALAAICLTALESYVARIKGVMAADHSIVDAVYQAVLGHFVTLNENANYYVTFLTCHQFLPDPQRREAGSLSRDYEKCLEKVIQKAVDQGELKPIPDMAFTVSSLLALCNNIAIAHKGQFGLTVEDLARRITDVFFSGLVQRR